MSQWRSSRAKPLPELRPYLLAMSTAAREMQIPAALYSHLGRRKALSPLKYIIRNGLQIKSLDPKPLNSQNDRIQTQSLPVGPLADICTSVTNTHRCSVKNEGILSLLTDIPIHLLKDFRPHTSCIKATIRRKVPS